MVARRLAPLHVSAVASPEYLQGRQASRQPHELTMLDGLSMRSAHTGRVRVWRMRNREGVETTLEHKARMVANDPRLAWGSAISNSVAHWMVQTTIGCGIIAPQRKRSYQFHNAGPPQSGSDRFEIYFDPPSRWRASTRCWFSSGVPMLIRSLSRKPSSLNHRTKMRRAMRDR